MRLARIHSPEGSTVLAAAVGGGRLVSLEGLPGITDDVVDTVNRLGVARLQQLAAEQTETPDALLLEQARVSWAVPVARPQKIFCVALNYASHAAEGDQQAPSEPV